MIKFSDTCDVGEIVWYVNPSTKDVVWATEGEDNRNYYSFHGIREGVLAHPEKLNHFDLWLTEEYSIPQVKGFINIRNDGGEEIFKFKEVELTDKFNKWCKDVTAGKLSSDGNKLYIVSKELSSPIAKTVCNYFAKIGMININTMIYWNGEPQIDVKTLFMPHNQIFVKADIESDDVLHYIDEYKKGSQEAGERLLALYEKMIKGIVYKAVKQRNKVHMFEDAYQEMIIKFLELINNYDASKAKVSTYIYNSIQGSVSNLFKKEKLREFESLDEPHGTPEEGLSSGKDLLESKPEEPVEIKGDLKEILESVLEPKLYQIVGDYFIGDKSLREIGKETGYSQESIRLFVNKALDKLKSNPKFLEYSLEVESIKIGMLFRNGIRKIKLSSIQANISSDSN